MDYREKQYWESRRQAEEARRERERELAMQFPPGTLEEADRDFRLKLWQDSDKKRKELEAKGCRCEWGAAGEEGNLAYMVARIPQSNCPLHRQEGQEREERVKAQERARQVREQAQKAQKQEEERRRAAKEEMKNVFQWIIAGLVALFVVTLVVAIPSLVIVSLVLGGTKVGDAVGGVLVLCVWVITFIWFTRFLKG